MIYIDESKTDESNVVIRVEGTLNSEFLPVLQEVYAKHVAAGREIAVDLGSITSVDRNAKAFLKKVRDAVSFVDMPAYLALEVGVDTNG